MRKLALLLFAAGIATGFIAQAQSVAGNATMGFKKDLTGLFVLTVKDPEGIKEFWLTPAGKGRYGGEINCPRVFVNNTVSLEDPADFTPQLAAYVIDCQGNREDFVIAPPKNGVTFGAKPASAGATAGKPVEEKAKEEPKQKTAAVPASETERPTPKAIIAPVSELGNCASEKECRAYCDDPANMEACVAYAERNNRLSAGEISRARRFIEVQKKGGGPGGCTTPDSCVSYCEDIAHIDQCLAFAEENNFLPTEELADARRAAKAKRDGVAFPGGCTSKQSCEAYCSDGAHGEECLAFAEKTGFLPPEKLAEARKMMEFLRRGETPGGCKSEVSCNAYCEGEGHFDECVAFAEKAGFMTPDEARVIREAGGKGPGGCKSKTQCETFCNDPAHLDECIDFGVKAGLVKPEEAEMVRKAGGKGPGNCRSKELCEAYCANPAHSEECMDFALRAGLIKPEEAEMVRKAGGKLPGGCRGFAECQAYCTAPEHQDECKDLIGAIGGTLPGEHEFEVPSEEQRRNELFEQERQRHVQNVQREDPRIIACFKAAAGDELFARRQAARLNGKAESLRVETMLRSCGATFVSRWQEIITEAQSERPDDYACLQKKLGQDVLDRILSGEDVHGSSWVIESECRFLSAPGGFAPQAVMPDIPVSIPTTGAGAPDAEAIKKQIEEQYKTQLPAVPPGHEAEYERQKQLIEEQYRQQYQQQYQGQSF